MLFFIPVTMYIVYKLFFVHENSFSKQKEYQFISKDFEKNYIGALASKTLNEEFKGKIYKQNTEETIRVNKVVNTLIDKNKIRKIIFKTPQNLNFRKIFTGYNSKSYSYSDYWSCNDTR